MKFYVLQIHHHHKMKAAQIRTIYSFLLTLILVALLLSPEMTQRSSQTFHGRDRVCHPMQILQTKIEFW